MGYSFVLFVQEALPMVTNGIVELTSDVLVPLGMVQRALS